MKPMHVEAGEYAPDVDEMIEKAGSMIEKLQMDNSQIRNITGVEEAPMNHYHTNQYVEETSEDVTNKGATSENVKFIDANPHQTGSTLNAHENPSGGDPHPPSSYTHSSVGKPPSDIKKEIEIILKKRCPDCGGNHKLEKNVSCSVKKAGSPLDALAQLGAKGKGGPPPMPDEGMPDEGMPDEGMPDMLDEGGGDPASNAKKIKQLATELVGQLGGGDDMEDALPDMGPDEDPMGGGGLPPGGGPGSM